MTSLPDVALARRRPVVVRGDDPVDIVIRVELPLGYPVREVAAAIRAALRSRFPSITGRSVAVVDLTFTGFRRREVNR